MNGTILVLKNLRIYQDGILKFLREKVKKGYDLLKKGEKIPEV